MMTAINPTGYTRYEMRLRQPSCPIQARDDATPSADNPIVIPPARPENANLLTERPSSARVVYGRPKNLVCRKPLGIVVIASHQTFAVTACELQLWRTENRKWLA